MTMAKKAFTFEIEGIDKLLKAIDKLSDKTKQDVNAAIENFVKDVNNQQVRSTPVDTGDLRRSNIFHRDPTVDIGWVLENPKDYAAFVEFGTGASVHVPEGLADYAQQFKGKGIKEVNLPARPFFFTPFLNGRKKLIEDIKKAIKK